MTVLRCSDATMVKPSGVNTPRAIFMADVDSTESWPEQSGRPKGQMRRKEGATPFNGMLG